MIDMGATLLSAGLAARRNPRPLREMILLPSYSVRSTARMKSTET